MAKRERSHSEFCLDALVVVEVDIAVNHGVGFAQRGRFVAVDAFGFENGEEVFRHDIVVGITAS